MPYERTTAAQHKAVCSALSECTKPAGSTNKLPEVKPNLSEGEPTPGMIESRCMKEESASASAGELMKNLNFQNLTSCTFNIHMKI